MKYLLIFSLLATLYSCDKIDLPIENDLPVENNTQKPEILRNQYKLVSIKYHENYFKDYFYNEERLTMKTSFLKSANFQPGNSNSLMWDTIYYTYDNNDVNVLALRYEVLEIIDNPVSYINYPVDTLFQEKFYFDENGNIVKYFQHYFSDSYYVFAYEDDNMIKRARYSEPPPAIIDDNDWGTFYKYNGNTLVGIIQRLGDGGHKCYQFSWDGDHLTNIVQYDSLSQEDLVIVSPT
jgi:hypothetical protein